MQVTSQDESPRQDKNAIQKPIIFFDGVCGMCNAFVDFTLRVDRQEKFLFAPLQGSLARELLPPLSEDPRQWSIIYMDERGIHDQSDAVLQVYRRLGGRWWLFSLARHIPRSIRNALYRVIARNRYRWFDRKEQCRVPNPEERKRFLP
jgi:predicted DCC family thiol-disulfide oxidoreductase YuxK